jgi:hypothetical protein
MQIDTTGASPHARGIGRRVALARSFCQDGADPFAAERIAFREKGGNNGPLQGRMAVCDDGERRQRERRERGGQPREAVEELRPHARACPSLRGKNEPALLLESLARSGLVQVDSDAQSRSRHARLA